MLAYRAQVFLLSLGLTHLEGVRLPSGLEVVGVHHEYDLVSVDHTSPRDNLAVTQV